MYVGGGFADFEGAFGGGNTSQPTTKVQGNTVCAFVLSVDIILIYILAAPDFGDFAGSQPSQVQSMPASSSVQPQHDFGAFQGMPSVTPQAPVSTHTHTHLR